MSYLNDPRVLFAAERTLLAWNRTSLALMAFGFLIERSGLLIELLGQQAKAGDGRFAFWIGLAFIVLGAVAAIFSVMQYRLALQSLQPAEIPNGYRVNAGVVVNLAVAVVGFLLTAFLLLRHF
jgi:putative membrane protein